VHERLRYLAQQAELGGSELIIGRRERSAPEPEAPLAPDHDAEHPDSAASTEPSWMRGAPPIPGPGLTVDPPPAEFLRPEVGSLPTIDAVAEFIRTTWCCETLCPTRTHAVPGDGNPTADLVLVGEGPGAKEDETGSPFVGAAGALLSKMLEAIGLRREDVFICNVVKCRPPQNRKPEPHEMTACMPYLWRQLELVRPKVIIALGGTAAEALLGVKQSLGSLRNKVHTLGGASLVVTYHPAALLRNPNWKKPAWDDVRIARQLLDRDR
jgi:uracil-DNA glycosylase